MVRKIIVHPNGLLQMFQRADRKRKEGSTITLLLFLCVEFIFIKISRGSKPPTKAAVKEILSTRSSKMNSFQKKY